MPWPEKQREAIFLDTQRRHGTAAAKKVMHEAGYGGGTLRAKMEKAGGRQKRRRGRSRRAQRPARP